MTKHKKGKNSLNSALNGALTSGLRSSLARSDEDEDGLILPITNGLLFQVAAFQSGKSKSELVTVDGSNRVSVWIDLSGNNRDVVQTAGNIKPIYNESAFNGLPALTFDGNDLLSNTSFPDISLVTMFAVAEYQANDTSQGLVEISTGIVNTGTSFFRTNDNLVFRVWDGAFKDINFSASFPANHIFTGIADGTNSTYFVDGDQKGIIATGSIINTLSEIYIGRLSNFATFTLVGTVGEVIVYDRALSIPERISVEEYLSAKWGITLG